MPDNVPDDNEEDILLQVLKEDMDVEEAEERYRQVLEVEELLEKYHDRVKWERDRRSQIILAERTGEQRGLAKGRVEGRVEGRVDVARRMKAHGDSLEYITEATGLSVDEVNEID